MRNNEALRRQRMSGQACDVRRSTPSLSLKHISLGLETPFSSLYGKGRGKSNSTNLFFVVHRS
jgi:hypothetical protein